MHPIAIRSLGRSIPHTVRENDYWTPEVVEGWGRTAPRPGPASAPQDASDAVVRKARAALGDDPFRGARRRRVVEPGTREVDLQIAAAKDALANAQIDPTDIKVLLTCSTMSEARGVPDVPLIHRELGLGSDVLAVQVDNACNSFLQQLDIARAMLRDGEFALLTQGCLGSELTEPNSNHQPWFGDGATAELIGPSDGGAQLLGFAHATDGSTHEALQIRVEGGRWFDPGRPYFHLLDRKLGVKMFRNVARWALDLTTRAREAAGVSKSDIDFFACHQGQAWLRPALQEHCGLEHARTLDTFADYASLSAANIPLILGLASEQGLLRRGDVVQAFSGGVGETFASAVFRW